MRPRTNRISPQRRRLLVGLFAALGCAVAISPVGGAIAQDLQSQLDAKRAQLDEADQQEGVLSSEIAHYSERIDQVAGEVAILRNREAIVQAKLVEVKARLRREKHHLEILQARLGRSLKVLRDRLVAIYRSDEPDALTVILNSDGFDDLLDRFEYLRRIEEQDASIVNRVRGLRDETRDTVERIEAARDEIAARKAELERTRMELEAREAELDAVRNRKQGALDEVQATQERLEGDIGDLEGQIQAELQAVQSQTTPLPAGPIQGESASGFIWPVNGPVVSPFGMRWGRLHAGIDIAVPAGTPIRASKGGSIALAAPYGGYGNYTCIDHGGGVSSCYAHQSSFAVTSGTVSQGQVIGYVGCTGHCFGDHLHFEIRINGAPTDPLGYL
jgi:murein DD-endopeptidase MepM/ murein hydrolase activator NlpD